MSLQVWLPLNGDLHNQGLTKLTVSNHGATIDNNGKIGKCYYFNGSSQYLQLSKSLTNLYAGDFSWAIWLKPTDATRGIIFSEYSSTGASNVAFELLANRVIRVYWAASPDWSTGVSIAQNIWSHVAITRHGNTLKVYVNGELKATKSDATLANKTSSSFIRLGDDYRGGTSVSYMGYMNDARIYDHCLSQKEVEEIAKGLVLHYKLDQNSMGGNNLALHTRDLSVGSSKNNLNMYIRGAAKRQLRDDGFYVSRCTANWQGLSFWANQLNLSVGTKVTYSFYIYGDGTSHAFSFYPMMYNSAGTRDTSTGLPISIDGGSYTTSNAKAFGNTTATTPEYHYVTFEWNSAVANIIANGGSIELSIQAHGTWSSGSWVCFFAPKVEFGATPTSWSPAASETNNANKIYDISGYNNNGDTTNAILATTSPRYDRAITLNGITVDNSSNTKTGAAYLRGFLSLTSPSALTVSWWGKNDAYGRGGIFQTTVNADPSECTDYNTTAIANWDTTFRVYNGSTAVNFFSNFVKDSNWHYHTITYDGAYVKYFCDGIQKVSSALTGALPSFNGFCMGLGKAGGVYRQIKQSIADLRIYVTALSENQILELYNTSATIDNKGNVYSREYIENNKLNITKTGLFQCNKIYDDDELTIASIVKSTQQVQGNTIYEY